MQTTMSSDLPIRKYNQDALLWQKLRRGDKLSFSQLYRKFYSGLFYYGIKIFPNEDLIEESIHELFIRIWETKTHLGKVENVKAYLLISLRRLILKKKDHIVSKNTISIDSIENKSFHFDENEFESHPEVSEELRQILLKAINSLTKKQKELIFLYFYHGLSYKEISEVMEIGIQATRNLMYRTLIHLRKSIDDKSLANMKNMLLLFFSMIPPKK